MRFDSETHKGCPSYQTKTDPAGGGAILINDQGTCLKFCSSPMRLSEDLFNQYLDGTRGRFLVFSFSDSLTRFLSQRAQHGAKQKPQ